MLRAIVFVCGAALMALELVAARVLAPALGNSIFVWGSVISMVMLALSLGYWVGGQLADRVSAARALSPLIAGAGLLTVLAPLIAVATLPWAAELGPRIGSLAASAAIFFLPALLLATVSPLAVRLAASDGLDRIGRSAGSLYAISTAGSIVGTLATAFWLIPALSLAPLIVAIGFTLFACALAALTLPRLTEASDGGAETRPTAQHRVSRPVAAALAIVLVGAITGAAVLARVAPVSATNERGERVLFRADTQYHRITVTEADNIRHLRFDATNQSAIDLTDGYRSTIAYPNYFDLALAIKPDAKRVLVLGMGGGAITKRWWRDYPDMTIDSVEIDPVVVDVASRYFGLPEDARLGVFTTDARRYVQTTDKTYDVVIVDAYYADSLPFHLTTSEFLSEVKSRMAPDGVLAYNVISTVSGERSKLFRTTYRTAGGVWDHLWAFPIGLSKDGDAEKRRNIIVLASDADIPASEVLRRTSTGVDGRVKLDGFSGFSADLYTAIVPLGDVPVMTDAYAPTDSLIDVR
jgi:predicted membrane-bound spermidine synthase